MAKSFWISAVVVTVIAAILGLGAAWALNSLGGTTFALTFVNFDALYGGRSAMVDATVASIAAESSLHIMTLMVGACTAIAWGWGLLWVGLAHRTEINRPGLAARNFVRWLLLGLASLAVTAVAIWWLSRDAATPTSIPFKTDAIVTFLIAGLLGSTLIYWLSTLLATPVRLRPAVPCAPLLP